jgi:hypothetical protein
MEEDNLLIRKVYEECVKKSYNNGLSKTEQDSGGARGI